MAPIPGDSSVLWYFFGNSEMPRRTRSQQIGSLGQRIAATPFERLGSWIVRNQEEDVGIDLEVELSDPDPRGQFLKCPIKSFNGKSAPKPARLKNDFLKYVYECRIPILLVQIETTSDRSCEQACVEISQGSFLFPSYLVIDEVLRLGNRIWGTL